MKRFDVDRMTQDKDIDGLIRALEDKDEMVRKRAVEALGAIGDERATGPLQRVMKDDPAEDVRIRAGASYNRLMECLLTAKEARTIMKQAKR
jgi:HEAT repeat protein